MSGRTTLVLSLHHPPNGWHTIPDDHTRQGAVGGQTSRRTLEVAMLPSRIRSHRPARQALATTLRALCVVVAVGLFVSACDVSWLFGSGSNHTQSSPTATPSPTPTATPTEA